MYRFLRCFLCLLVVCCLIINLSPIKADATAAGAAIAGASAVAAPAALVVGAGLIALGIMAGTNDDFQRVVSNAADALGDWVKDGTVQLFQTVDELGKKTYFMAADMMEDLRLWSSDSGIYTISNSAVYDYSTSEAVISAYNEAMNYPYHCVAYNITNHCWYFIGSDGELRFTENDNGYFIGGTTARVYFYHLVSAQSVTLTSSKATASTGTFENISNTGIVSDFVSSYDLIFGQVPSVPVDGTSAREWSEEYTNRGLYVDPAGDGDGNDEDGKWYWPLVLAPGVESLTQTDQWTGTTVDEFDDYETEEEYEIVGTPVVPFGSSVQLKPVTVPDVGDDTEVDSGTTDGTADYTSWFDKIVGFLQNIWDSIKELPSKFATWFEAIIDGIQALPGKFATWFETIIDGIQAIPDVISGWFTDVIEWLTSIWEAICSIPTLILDGITAIFVPSEDFVTTKVEALRERFSWIEPILGYGDYIKAQLIDPEPPVLYVHLGNAEGSYNYGGTVKFLDLTWYERYKSQGDAIISGFLWALFAWRMYVKLPGIINGVAGDVGHISYGESAWQKTEGRKERKEKGGKNK